MRRRIVIAILLIAVVLLLAACVPGKSAYSEEHPATFWSGLWHGMISDFLFIGEIFDNNIRVYQREYNTGLGYDLGFLIGIGSFNIGVFRGFKIRIKTSPTAVRTTRRSTNGSEFSDY